MFLQIAHMEFWRITITNTIPRRKDKLCTIGAARYIPTCANFATCRIMHWHANMLLDIMRLFLGNVVFCVDAIWWNLMTNRQHLAATRSRMQQNFRQRTFTTLHFVQHNCITCMCGFCGNNSRTYAGSGAQYRANKCNNNVSNLREEPTCYNNLTRITMWTFKITCRWFCTFCNHRPGCTI